MTPIGSFAFPNSLNIATARETAGTARIRNGDFSGFTSIENFSAVDRII
jgi:hypothetical protein